MVDMLLCLAKLPEWPAASYHPFSRCASGMSGSTVMVPDDSSESERPAKSETRTPLKATTDSGLTSKLVAVLPHIVTLTEYELSSTRVLSCLLLGFCVVLDVME